MSEKTLSQRPISLYKLLCYSPFVFLFFYTLSLARQGVDVTDTGFNLYNQQLLLKGKAESTLLWFSDFIGGFWQMIVPVGGYLGASIGWCVLVLIFSGLTARLLRSWITFGEAALVSLLVGVILIGGRLEILYYTNLGTFFLTLGSLTFLKYRTTGNRKLVILYGLLAGITLGCRLPSVLGFLCFPLIPVVLDLIFLRKLRGIKDLILLWLASLGGVLLFLILTLSLGLWESFEYSFKLMFGFIADVPIQEEHGSFVLLGIYQKHLFWRWSWALGYLGLVSLSLVGLGRISSARRRKTAFLAVSVFLVALVFTVSDKNLNNFRAALGSFSIFTALFTSLIVLVKSLKKSPISYYSLFTLQWVFLCVAVLSFAGSSAGFLNMHLGQWFLLPLQFILLFEIFGTDHSDKKHYFLSLLTFLLPLGLLGLSIVPLNPYRDLPGWSKLDTSFEEETLQGIKSSSQRVKSFEEFIKVAKAYVKPGDVVLAYNSIPLFYFLTRTESFLENSWPTIQGVKALSFYLSKKENKKLPPFLFRALTNTQSLHWGNGQKIAPHSIISQQAVVYLDEWARRNGYRVLWTNQDFTILGRSNPR